jgi:hypothetical protein
MRTLIGVFEADYRSSTTDPSLKKLRFLSLCSEKRNSTFVLLFHCRNGVIYEKEERQEKGLPGTPIALPGLVKPTNLNQKPKLKVGKARAKADNFTDTSFKAKCTFTVLHKGDIVTIRDRKYERGEISRL